MLLLQLTKKQRLNNQRGFTLIELIVVILIVGVLAALILAALSSAQKGSRDTKRRSDLRQIWTGIRNYHASHNNTYPIRATEVKVTDLTELTINQEYLTVFPDPPVGTYDTYTYVSTADGQGLGICTRLEKPSDKMIQMAPDGYHEVDEGPCAPTIQ